MTGARQSSAAAPRRLLDLSPTRKTTLLTLAVRRGRVPPGTTLLRGALPEGLHQLVDSVHPRLTQASRQTIPAYRTAFNKLMRGGLTEGFISPMLEKEIKVNARSVRKETAKRWLTPYAADAAEDNETTEQTAAVAMANLNDDEEGIMFGTL
eukprot:g13827.t1